MTNELPLPVLDNFDPLEPSAVDEALVVGWARARREAPVLYVPEQNWWCVTTVALAEEVLRRPQEFSSAISGSPQFSVPDEVKERLSDGWPLHPNLASLDPPEHTRVRRMVQGSFTPRAALDRVASIRVVAESLVDRFIADGHVDLATEYTRLIPISVIAPIFGVPLEDGMRLYQWAHEAMAMVINPALTEREVLQMAYSQAEFDAYVRATIADRRQNPRGDGDLLTELIFATGEAGEPKLSDSELLALVVGIIAAGTETTATALGHAIHTLLRQRELWEEAVRDPSLVANIVEEVLRMRSPVRSINRITTREVELGGVTVPAGVIVHLPFASLGRDEAIFARPDTFDPHRPNARQHMSFGRFTHICLGASLARQEIRVGLEVLLERIPGLRLVPDADPRHVPTVGVPVLIDGLRVEWDR